MCAPQHSYWYFGCSMMMLSCDALVPIITSYTCLLLISFISSNNSIFMCKLYLQLDIVFYTWWTQMIWVLFNIGTMKLLNRFCWNLVLWAYTSFIMQMWFMFVSVRNNNRTCIWSLGWNLLSNITAYKNNS
jgi:hypothetical protein